MNFSLRHKTNFAILATFIPISIIVGIIQFYFQDQRSQSMINKDKLLIETLVQRDMYALANEIFDKNIRAIKIRLRAMMQVKGLEAISVFDKSGHLLVADKIVYRNKNAAALDGVDLVHRDIDRTEQKDIQKHFKINQINQNNTSFLEYSQGINVIGELIGFIKVYYSLADIKKAKHQSYMIYGGLIVSIFMVMLILLNFILSKTVIMPITFLRDAMEHLRTKKIGEQIDVTTKDEIGDLSVTFNRMSMELARSYREIENQNKELLKSEKEINEVQLYLKNIIDSMPSMLVGVDNQGRITRWNSGAEDLTGIKKEDAERMKFKDILASCGFQKLDIEKSINEKTVQKKTKFPVIRDDKIRYFDMTIYPLKGSELKGAVIRIDDVTEYVRLEEVMIQSEKMLSVGGLAAGMAHEINNPLAGILQNTDVVVNRLKADIQANHKAAKAAGTDMSAISTFMENRDIFKILANVKNAGIRAAEIVNDMLGFARKSTGRFSLCHMDKLLDETLKIISADYDLKKHFDFKQIIIKKEYDSDLPQIFCDKGKIQQVIFNILQNGAHAMAETKGEGQEYSPQFIFRLKHEDKSVKLEIEDNGPGMDKEVSQRVFEPFFTTKPVGVGTGLGMSVSYFIITHNHKGSIKVESSPGKGTKFIIVLPLSGP